MYSLRDYGEMIADRERFEAYSKAIAKAVRPGDTVLEIGCGPGVLTLIASKAGARKVYAIESDDVLEFARQLAAANGLADRIEFIQGDSRKTELPERVNVIVSDIRGVLPFFDHAIPSIEDARRRFLAPGGTLIPRKDILKLGVIEATEYYCCLTAPWQGSPAGMDLRAALPLILNASYGGRFKREQLLTEVATWCELDYAAGANTNVSAEVPLRIARQGTAHGLCLWFETQLLDDIGYSTGPEATNSVYGQRFLPWLEEVAVEKDDEIQVRLQADLVGLDYVWRWETTIPPNGLRPEVHFQQSTFYGGQLSPASLHRRASDFVPTLSPEGQADRWLLLAMDGKVSLQEIAQRAAQQFPKIFPRWEDALRRAADLATQFSR